jgi:hypothetical protein
VLQAQDLWTPAAESYAGSPTTAMRLWRTRVEDDGSFFSLDGISCAWFSQPDDGR